MKNILLTTVALAALSLGAPAVAADLAPAPAQYKAPPPAMVGYNWSGFYVGGNIGGAWNSMNSTVLAPGSAAFPVGTAFTRHDLSGVIGGIQGGFNYQVGAFVVGVEGEYSWTSLNGTVSTTSIPFPGTVVLTTQKLTDIALATARAGYAADNWLFYVKGGGAWGHNDGNGTVTVGGAPFETSTSSADRSGWTAGAGVEWGFARNWSARLEYDHIDFGSKAVSTFGTVTGPGLVTTSETVDMVRAGVNYRFDWGGPVVARY